MKDTPVHQGQRQLLCQHLQEKGFVDPQVLEAIGKVPRHLFLESSFHQHAYQDKAFPIAAGQTISHPSTVAWQSTLLNLTPGMKVLEIGTGCGYQSAVLCEMGAKVYSVERQKDLFTFAKSLLPKMSYFITQSYGDGFKGMPSYAPFDRIIVTCGAPYVPKALLQQLKPNGIMVIPVEADGQKMVLINKNPDGTFVQKVLGDAAFVPMLKDKA